MRPVDQRLLRAGGLLAIAGCRSEAGLESTCAPSVFVSEVAAANEHANLAPQAYCDAQVGPAWCCEHADWVELYNAGDRAVDLSGYSLFVNTDFDDRVPFPDGTILGPKKRLVVEMSPFVGDDEECAGWLDTIEFAVVHGGIDLNRDGDRVILYSKYGDECDDVPYPDQHADASWAQIPEGVDAPFCDGDPTPGTQNESGHEDVKRCAR